MPSGRAPAEVTLPVAVDAMGGDHAPETVIEGAIEACQRGLGPVVLVGDETRLQAALDRHDVEGLPLRVEHAAEVIGMAEHPGRAARTKRNSSMHVGFSLVRNGQACAFVSAGNSGAMMAVGLLTLRRAATCDRPAIAAVVPTYGTPTVLLDMGANVDCRASHLVEFGLMGAAFAEIQLGIERPAVGLLCNGVEANKGTETLREAHRLLTMSNLKYVGYVEGDAVALGEVDVVVTDGFVGNVALKLSEGVTKALFKKLRDALSTDLLGRMGAKLIQRSLKAVQSELDASSTGGAPLLGLNGIAIVAHGNASATAIANAIATAREQEAAGLVERLQQALTDNGPLERTATNELPITRSSGAMSIVEEPR